MNKVFHQFLVGFNLILYLVSLFMWVALFEYFTINICISLFSLSLSGFLVFHRKQELNYYISSSHFKNFSQNTIQVFLILCILALVNYLVFQNPKQWDFTARKINRLSGQSIELVEKIDSTLKFKVYANREQARRILPLLELYRLENSLVEILLIDPEVSPLKVKADSISQYGQVKLEYLDRSAKFLEYSERAITNAIAKVFRNQKVTLYFATGHREPALDDTEGQGLSKLKGYLEALGYVVKKINFANLEQIEKINHVLILLGPKDGLLKKELSELKKFLQQKKPLLAALDPPLASGGYRTGFDPHASLRNLLAKSRGITIAGDFVVDTKLAVKDSGGAIPVIEQFDSLHPITSGMTGQVFFPLVSSIQFARDIDDFSRALTKLAQTSAFPASWAERDLSEVASEKVTFHQGKDLVGPIAVAGASERAGEERTFLVGNSSFLHNQYFDFQNNLTFFSNALDWLSGQADMISFERPRKEAEKNGALCSRLANLILFLGGANAGIAFKYFRILLSCKTQTFSFMKKNIFYLFVLIGLLVFTYYYQEVGQRLRAAKQNRQSSLFKGDTSTLLAIHFDNYHLLYSAGGEVSIEPSGLKASVSSVDNFLHQLSYIRVQREIFLSELETAEGEAIIKSFKANLRFIFEQEAMTFSLGAKVKFADAFYIRVTSGSNGEKVFLCFSSTPRLSVYDPGDEKSKREFGYRNLQALFSLTQEYFLKRP